MAKNESTAVNALIEQVSVGRPAPHFDEELMFSPRPKVARKVSPPRISGTVPPMNGAGEVSPLPRSRTPNGTQRNVPQLANEQVRMSGPSRARSIPPLPVASESMVKAFPPPPAPHAAQAMPAFSPSSLPLQSPPSTPPGMMIGDAPTYLPPGTSDAWFVNSQNATNEVHRDSFTIQTQRTRSGNLGALVGKLVGPMLILVVAGIFVGGYFAFDGQGNKDKAKAAAVQPAPAKSETAKVEPTQVEPAKVEPAKAEPANVEPAAPLPVAEPAKAEPTPEPAVASEAKPASPAPGASALVDVRIDSKPSGATVMLVDQGKTTFLGTTPLDAALDPSRKYELVFTHGDRPTRVESLDPSAQKRVAVVLAPSPAGGKVTKPEPAVAKTAPVVVAPSAADKARAERRAARKAREAAARAQKASAVDVVTEKPAAPAGEGVLMISSKPPCEIYIDGKATGLVTPQRSIALPAGNHKITLVNEAEKIKKTIAVQITADKPTKVIQDLMK